MIQDYVAPVSSDFVEWKQQLPPLSIGANLSVYSKGSEFPEISKGSIVIIAVDENRRAVQYTNASIDFDVIRKAVYQLFPGNWHTSIFDIGTIKQGNRIEDTYFAVSQCVSFLLRNECLPVILGGSQDVAYSQYRAYDDLNGMVNVVNVDSRFDIGDITGALNNRSYIGKIIVEQPYNLFNYSNIGYQTYYNSQEELDLIDKLYFEAYRLGEVIQDPYTVEPIMRDANMVCMDIEAINAPYLSYSIESPNGFDGREICSVARYAGISDKVSSFGIYEYRNEMKQNQVSALIAQIIWYFIEGVNCRSGELDIRNQSGTLHYSVPVEDEVLSFYKSPKTDRWWIEVPFVSNLNNKLKRHTLLPCDYKDYQDACNQELPDRWFKARKKNEV